MLRSSMVDLYNRDFKDNAVKFGVFSWKTKSKFFMSKIIVVPDGSLLVGRQTSNEEVELHFQGIP